MKKFLCFVMLLFLMIPLSVNADNMYNIDMDIYIDEFGNASITEVWDVDATSGSEWYKTMYGLGNSVLSNYKVYMDGEELIYDNSWDVDASLSEKSGYYGINNTYDGIELCFGKGDMDRHIFTLKYTLSNYVFNTDDSQVLYFTLLPRVTVDNFSANITSYYEFPDTLDVWGYGYKGYAYVSDGIISMSNEGSLYNEYVTLLVKFPVNTFNTLNKDSRFNSFSDVYNLAEEGTFEYDYEEYYDDEMSFFDFIMINIPFLSFILIVFISIRNIILSGYGYVGNKVIDKKNVPMFRDIPCNKDIYYANTLIKLNDFNYKQGNILGAIILKWIRNDKIGFLNEEVGEFNRNARIIDLTRNPVFDNDKETKLFKMMFEASCDGYLETKEFEKWCSNNYSKFLDLFTKIENEYINNLKDNGNIYKRVSKTECKKKNVMDDKIYNDSIELYGLKKYLLEFSKIDTRKLWKLNYGMNI